MAELHEFVDTLVVEHCYSCGIAFGMPRSLYNKLREKGPDCSFYCPSGHVQHYRYKKGDELEDQIKREKERVESLRRTIASQQETITAKDHRIRATRAAKTRLKNQIMNGTCPCCGEHFKNLESHMKGKHPDFVTT